MKSHDGSLPGHRDHSGLPHLSDCAKRGFRAVSASRARQCGWIKAMVEYLGTLGADRTGGQYVGACFPYLGAPTSIRDQGDLDTSFFWCPQSALSCGTCWGRAARRRDPLPGAIGRVLMSGQQLSGVSCRSVSCNAVTSRPSDGFCGSNLYGPLFVASWRVDGLTFRTWSVVDMEFP